MHTFSFNTTTRIHQEFSGAAHLGERCARTLTGPLMFVTDPGLMERGLAGPTLEDLESRGYSPYVFAEVAADPPQAVIERAVTLAREADIRAVVGFGGGSSMDVAKLIALLTPSTQSLAHVYGIDRATGPRLPLVLVPTTAGTGSEVTPIAIVTTGHSEKQAVVSPLLLPDVAFLDAQLTLGLPPDITAATGVDAMVHAIESYTSKNPNRNPISAMLAREALHLLGRNIERVVCEDGAGAQARSAMLLGAMLAGQAFANSPVAAVHALAYPIGGIFHVAHGLSNALVLPHVMKFNLQACADQYAELAPVVFPDLATGAPAEETALQFCERLASLIQRLGLATKLREVGIKAIDLDHLALDAMKQSRLLVNNPMPVTHDDALSIYNAAL